MSRRACGFLSLPDTYAVVLPKEDAVEDQGVKKCHQKSNQCVKNHRQKTNRVGKNHRWRIHQMKY
jgi:hypothetical protein